MHSSRFSLLGKRRITTQYRGKLKCAVFDWAGTVVDYGVKAPTYAFGKVFEKYKVPVSESEIRQFMGRFKRDHISCISKLPNVSAAWKKLYGVTPTEKNIDDMYRDFIPIQMESIRKFSKLIPGTKSTIDFLRNNYNLKIGSTTGYAFSMVDELAKQVKNQGYVPDKIVAADQVSIARPSPFMIYKNMMELGVVHPSSVVKIDDTVDGILEGSNAGAWTVGVAKSGNYVGKTEEELAALPAAKRNKLVSDAYKTLEKAGADFVVDDITVLPIVVNIINKHMSK